VRRVLETRKCRYLEDHQAGQETRSRAETVDLRGRVRLSLSRDKPVPSGRIVRNDYVVDAVDDGSLEWRNDAGKRKEVGYSCIREGCKV